MSLRSALVQGSFDQATLDREYSPSSCVPSLKRYLDEYAALSELARRSHRVLKDLSYGPHPEETLDFFPATRGGPVHVFVHGGNWQELTKESSAFPAPHFVRAGAAFAAVNYGLAPGYSLDEMVAMVRRCIRWLRTQAQELGVDPERLFLSGVSAGAHLVAMALVAESPEEPGLAERVAGVTLMSGLYDLQPVRRSYVNEALRLDAVSAERNSPVRRLPPRLPPVVLARGGQETSEFIRQHALMKGALQGRTALIEVVSEPRNHFDLSYDLGTRNTPLGDAVLAQMKLDERRTSDDR
jgi:arylformamidase